MSSFDVAIDPVFEELTKFCIDDVGQPLTRQQVEFFRIWQIVHEVLVLFSLLKHAVDGNVLILRAVDFQVLVCFDTFKFKLTAIFLTLLYS
jgi:hypothetical protein